MTKRYRVSVRRENGKVVTDRQYVALTVDEEAAKAADEAAHVAEVAQKAAAIEGLTAPQRRRRNIRQRIASGIADRDVEVFRDLRPYAREVAREQPRWGRRDVVTEAAGRLADDIYAERFG